MQEARLEHWWTSRETPCWHIAGQRSTLYLLTHPSRRTAKGSQNMNTHNEESYLKWGFQAQPWAQPPWERESLRNRVDSESKKPLLRFVLSQWLRDFRDLSHIFSPSSTHPFRVSVLLCAEYVWVVALDIPVLKPGFNGSTAPVQSFWLMLVTKNRGAHSCFMFAHWKSSFFGPVTVFISSKFNELIFHSWKNSRKWFKNCTDLQCN